MITVNFNGVIGNEITANDGLFQWDVGQVLAIEGLQFATAPQVCFGNRKQDFAYVVQSEFVGGKIQVGIPDKILQEATNVVVWVTYTTGLEKTTYNVITIPVNARKKPLDYVEVLPADVVDVKSYLELLRDDVDNLTVDYYAFKELFTGYNVPKIRTDLDNLINEVSGLKVGIANKTTTFSADGKTITEVGADGTTTTVFNDNGTITQTNVKNGVTTILDIYFDADGTIREVVRT